MADNRKFWFRVAIAVVVINVLGGVFAYLTNEPMHGFTHGALAIGFGLWARYLREQSDRSEEDFRVERPDKVELLEASVDDLERELHETRKRLDFADQLLAKRPKSPDAAFKDPNADS